MPYIKHALDDSHFATFEWFVKAWACHFGLDKRWHIRAEWSEDRDVRKYASVSYHEEGRTAVVWLSREYECIRPPSESLLCESAAREVIHVLLAPLADLAEAGSPRGRDPLGIEHEIVQTLVQISMRDHYETMRASCPIKA